MKLLKKYLVLFFLTNLLVSAKNTGQIKEPVFESKADSGTQKYNLRFQFQNRGVKKGYIEKKPQIYLRLSGSDIDGQELYLDAVKTLRVKAYQLFKKTKDNLGVVFYFPFVWDVELKDGTFYENGKGRIPELENFIAYTKDGRYRCYLYFIRYWYEDKKIFHDNKSADYNEIPKVPKNVVIYLEFL